MKPYEVEILVAEVGTGPDDDRLFHILYDGTVMDEQHFTVLGGEADAIRTRHEEAWQPSLSLAAAMAAAVAALSGPDRELTSDDLEAGVLERSTARRAFRRVERRGFDDERQHLARIVELIDGHEHVDAAEGIDAVDDAPGLPQDAVGAQPGGQELGLEVGDPGDDGDEVQAVHALTVAGRSPTSERVTSGASRNGHVDDPCTATFRR
jgi:hypothetical protein